MTITSLVVVSAAVLGKALASEACQGDQVCIDENTLLQGLNSIRQHVQPSKSTPSLQCAGIHEAEDASNLEGAHVHANTNSRGHQGFTGESFVDYTSSDGAIEWNIEHCRGGAASVSFRYALRGGDRPLKVEVNNEVVQASLSFPPTGSWATWGHSASVQIPLVAGTNKIRLVGTGESGANLDSMTLIPVAQAGMKCPHIHEDRLFRTPDAGVSDVTIGDCEQQCVSTTGCNYFSYGPYKGAFVCMGCTQSVNAQSHEGFNIYQIANPVPEPTHYLTVVSWPEWAWDPWNSDLKGPIAKCSPKVLTSDPEGSGTFFTSCCTTEGVGMRRRCRDTDSTNFETAVGHCEDQGGRLCTAEEVVAQDDRARRTTATQGCQVDGPQGASGPDLKRLWTSSPCSPSCVGDGHYIRHDVGTAIFWVECGVKYWVASCSMCDDILASEHHPCNSDSWIDTSQEDIDALLTDGGHPGVPDTSPTYGARFQCTQHSGYSQ